MMREAIMSSISSRSHSKLLTPPPSYGWQLAMPISPRSYTYIRSVRADEAEPPTRAVLGTCSSSGATGAVVGARRAGRGAGSAAGVAHVPAHDEAATAADVATDDGSTAEASEDHIERPESILSEASDVPHLRHEGRVHCEPSESS